MLKQENRLKSNKAFNATYNLKNSQIENSIVLYIGNIKTDKNCPSRVGFVVSKKIHKRAVKRNRIKRLMRESLRLIIKNNECEFINNYQSLIFIARMNSLNKTQEEIRKTILILLNKLANN